MGDVLTRTTGRRGSSGRPGSSPSAHQTSFAMSDALTEDELLGEPGTDAHDPHIWMDIALWTRCVESVSGALMQFLPDSAQQIATRFEDLRERLMQLDQKAIEAVQTIPESQRVLISSHDAFQYFGRRYGLRVEGVQGISTASEAGLQRIPELIDTVVSQRIPAVFKESSVGGKLIDALIAGAKARGVELLIGNELYSDALGPVGSGAETYVGMMAHNFNSVITALGGKWG
jgi:manganese/zinc/iron transport system substrate-binding protein